MAEDSETKTPRVSAHVDHVGGTVTVGDDRYDMNGLSDTTLKWLAGRGLVVYMGRQADRPAAWKKLVDGTMASRGPAKPKEPSDTEKAIAMAMADEMAEGRGVKKSEKDKMQAIMEEAARTVAGMSRSARTAARSNAAVLAYIAKLKGKGGQQTSLLALAAE